MEAKDVRFKIFINNSETQLIKNPDPNWAKILDPDSNSMYLDPLNSTESHLNLKEKTVLRIRTTCGRIRTILSR